jgi:HAD superfamily hydrolase (TIGR01458 family)
MIKNKFEGIIFDVDGVLEYQGKIYPGAVELLDSLRAKGVVIRVVTNSTLKSRKSCTDKLQKKGFNISEDEVITASFATARYLEALNPRSCWIMLKGEGLEEFKRFNQDMEHPEFIVLGDLREDFSFHTMNKALKLLLDGSKFIVMITEIVDNSMGSVELTVGAYGKMLENAAQIKATYIGKPNRYIFEMALTTMGIENNKVLMVGDKIATDILGAKNAGIKSALVKTGEFKETDLHSDVEPDFVLDSVKEIGRLFSIETS